MWLKIAHAIIGTGASINLGSPERRTKLLTARCYIQWELPETGLLVSRVAAPASAFVCFDLKVPEGSDLSCPL
jgi:hypothetical protein